MNNKGLSCSTVILLITIIFQGCTQLGTQVSKVKSVLPGNQLPENYLAVARSLEKKSEWHEARQHYEKFLQKNPDSVIACHRLGIVCSHLGDTISATRYFTQARQLDPTNSEVLNDFGFALYKRGQYQAAEKIFSAALNNDANNKRIMNNLALTIGQQGRFKESYSLFRNIMPAGEAHANLAYIHTQRGEGEKALKEYDLALTADPELESVGTAVAELVELKNITLARHAKKQEQQLAASKAAPQTKPTSKIKPETQPKKQKIQLARSSQPAQKTQKPNLEKSKPAALKSMISQASLKKVKIEKTPQASVPKPEPQEAQEPLEINSFRSVEEIEQEEKPVIIRISNEVTQEEPAFRSPRELTNTIR